MSFANVRDMSEHLKMLGYSDDVPLSVLSTPYGGPESFKIYAEILQFLIKRLEPNYIVPGGSSNENDRVLFIKSASEFLIIKAGIKVNPKKLYSSSCAAAQEILKITTLLLNVPQKIDNDDDSLNSIVDFDISDKITELRQVRELSSELTNRGATLYDLLAKELVNKDTRTMQSSRPLEIANVEKVLKQAISSAESKLETAKSVLENSKVELQTLDSKLQRKSSELDRSKQRLQALQKVRPAYLDEFERLEVELKGLYEQYIVRIRCMDALKFQMALKNRTPTPSSALGKIAESSMTILPEGLMDSDDDEDEDDNDNDENLKMESKSLRDELLHTNHPRSNTRVNRVRTAGRGGMRLRGSMSGSHQPDIDNLDSSLGSDDSGSEIDLGDEVGLMDDFRSDEDGTTTVTNIPKMKRETSNLNRQPKQDLSDEDF